MRANNVFGDKITLNNAEEDQYNSLFETAEFKKNTKPKNPQKKEQMILLRA